MITDYETWVHERATSIVSRITFKQFVDCVKAADKRLAWGTRTHYYFMVNGEELTFSHAEMGRYAKYFKPDMYMTEYRFRLLLDNGAIISRLAFDEIDVFSLNLNGMGKKFAYSKLCQNYDASKAINWIALHNQAIAKAKVTHDFVPTQADYDTEQADLNAEMEVQRYG